MSNVVPRPASIGIDDYLEGEPLTDIKHEYLDGEVVAMGARARSTGWS